MALTDVAVRSAQPKEKPYKLYDVDGLYVLVRVSGSKVWCVKYYFSGKERHLTLSPRYPELSVRGARLKAAEARQLLADGIDPANKKQEDKRKVLRAVAGTFSALVEDWYAGWSKTVAVSTAGQMRAVIDSHLIPKLGNRVAADLEPHDLLAELRKIESNAGQDQAHRALRVCVSTLRHALALGYVKRNAALDIKGMLTPIKNEHYRSVTTPVEFGTLLHKLWEYTDLEKNAWPGGPTPYTAYALRTLPYLALRPGEVRNMRWDWLRDETLVIPAAQMKMRKEFATVMDSNVARFGAMLVFTGKDRR